MSLKVFALFVLLVTAPILGFAQNEQAPIVEKEFSYKNWNYKNVRDGGETDLRNFAKDKKLVLVVYFAPWCGNWKHEAPFVEKLYEKYKTQGFDVIGVGEYDTVEATRANLEAMKITFPVVYESESRAAKQKTLHYDYRTKAGDTRSWGSPWNVFLLPASIQTNGDVLTTRTPVVNGELIEVEAENYVREKLGLSAEKGKSVSTNSNEVCDPDKPSTTLKKPDSKP
jgi:thiol-disulfide isomerase/thioredoxin